MAFSVFINFDGNCREAVAFYAKAFESKVAYLQTYSEAPPSDYAVSDADKEKIMYAQVNIFGTDVMFSDNPSDMPLVRGNSVSPTVSTKDQDALRRAFEALSEGGEVEMPLGSTFWSDLYGMVTDQYGIVWQVMHESDEGY